MASDSGGTRILAGVASLVLVWIVVYWVYQPAGRGPSQTPASLETVPDSLQITLGGSLDEPDAQARAQTETDPAAGIDLPPPIDPTDRGAPADAVVPPRFERYTVGPSETFQTIARDRYGSVALWTVIAQANPLVDPERPLEGRTISVPLDPGNVQGVPVAETTGGRANRQPDRAPTTEYTVRPGDTLSGIAQRLLGSSARAREIFELNRDRMPSMDSLRVGQVIMVPRESPAGGA
ncbi:MAG: LysM domain-containing protein [Planctomycetota bacterium]